MHFWSYLLRYPHEVLVWGKILGTFLQSCLFHCLLAWLNDKFSKIPVYFEVILKVDKLKNLVQTTAFIRQLFLGSFERLFYSAEFIKLVHCTSHVFPVARIFDTNARPGPLLVIRDASGGGRTH